MDNNVTEIFTDRKENKMVYNTKKGETEEKGREKSNATN